MDPDSKDDSQKPSGEEPLDSVKAAGKEAAKVVYSTQNLPAYLIGGVVFLIVVPMGLLNVLAAVGKWNPLHIEGRLWSGLLMILAPTVLALVAGLPYRYRHKIPDQVGCLLVLAVWVAMFFAFCSGR